MREILALVLLLAVAAPGAATDGTAILGSSLSVEDVHFSAANTGADSHLQFIIRNESREPLVLLGVESSLSPSIRLMARVGANEWTEIGSITIATEAALDLGSSHMRIVVERLEFALQPDSIVPVTLRFSRGALTVMAHVEG